MGKTPGRRGDTRLVDMSVADPPPPPYYPPRPDECEEAGELPIDITPTERISGRASIHRGKTVEFSLTVQIRETTALDWRDVIRIDCAHGEVHSHQFFRGGGEERELICPIPTGKSDWESWDVVDTQYDAAISSLTEGLDDYVARWRTR